MIHFEAFELSRTKLLGMNLKIHFLKHGLVVVNDANRVPSVRRPIMAGPCRSVEVS